MKNNPVFLRVLNYITTNNITKTQIMNATDQQFLNVMYPPDGIRSEGDYTQIQSIKTCLVHIYRERKQAARISDIISRIEGEENYG